VSDVFHEVDEAYRAEQLQKLWKRYGHYVVIAAVLAVAGVGGWRGYEWWEAKKAAEAGDKFEAAAALAESGKHAEAEAAFAKIVTEGTAGYKRLARLRELAQLAEHDAKAAATAYEKLATDPSLSQVFQDVAAVRASELLVDGGDYGKIQQLLEPAAAADRAFRHTARELLALAAWRKGDGAAVKRWSELIMTDPLTPSATRTRTEMLVALIAAEGKS
jgi:hypothetical protein